MLFIVYYGLFFTLDGIKNYIHFEKKNQYKKRRTKMKNLLSRAYAFVI